jgi:hypothetical protein
MRRDDVPQQHALGELELGEDAVDDGRRRLGGARAGELALGRERDARDTRAAVARGLADEEQRRLPVLGEIGGEALAEQAGARAVGVLVVRPADPRPCKVGHQRLNVHRASLAPR